MMRNRRRGFSNRLWFSIAVGTVWGLAVSWYIYGVVWQWPLYFMIASWVGGDYFQRWYARRQKRNSTGSPAAPS